MTSIRASFLVIVVAALAWTGSAASASPSVTPSEAFVRCENASPPATVDEREDTLVAPADACSTPAEMQQTVWPSPILPYDGDGGTAHLRPHRAGGDFLGSVAAFAHVFAAFDVATAHRLIPHFARRHRVVPNASIPSF